jgi:ABC-2 type transport system permease protein
MRNGDFREAGLVNSLFKLLRLRLIILYNGFRRAKRRAKITYIFLAILVLCLLVSLLAVSTLVLQLLRLPALARYAADTARLLESFPSMVLTIAGSGILLTSFGVLLQTLYISGDMDFLMTAPVPVRAVFLAKMIQAVLPNFVILSTLTLPALFGLGISNHYHIFYYPLVVLTLTCIAVTASSVAGLVVLVVARFFPPRRVAEVLGFIVGMSVFLGSQLSQYRHSDSLMNKGKVVFFVHSIERFNSSWSPIAWAGRGLIDVGKSNWTSAIGLLSAALVLSGIVFCAALATCEQLYYTGWARLQNGSKIKSKPRISAAPGRTKTHPFARLIPAPAYAIMSKDLRMCTRDLSNLSGLLFPLILGVLYAIGLFQSKWQMPAGKGHAPAGFIQAGNTLFQYGDMALALFLGWTLISNLAGLAFTREGKNYWILKAAPISTRQMLAGKFLTAYVPTTAICSLYVLTLEILKRVDLLSIAVSLISVWLMVAGLCGIYLTFGITGAKFDWENPAQRNRSLGCFSMLVGMVFVLICFVLFIAPALLAQAFKLPLILGRIAGLMLGGAGNILAVVVPLAMVEKKILTLDES